MTGQAAPNYIFIVNLQIDLSASVQGFAGPSEDGVLEQKSHLPLILDIGKMFSKAGFC